MKIKLANTRTVQDGVNVKNVSQTLFIDGNNAEKTGAAAPIAKIQMNTDKAKPTDFKRYAEFFKQGDVSTIEVYNDEGTELITTLHGESVESVSQDIQNDSSNIYISINV